MEAVICDTVHGRDEFAALPDGLKKRFICDARATVAVQSKRSEDFARIYRTLREKGLSPLVVKGISCRRLWKNPDARPSGDEDLLIRPEWLGDVLAVMEENGFAVSREGDVVCYSPLSGLTVEIHTSLFPTDSEYFSGFNGCFDRVFESPDLFTACGTEFLTPEPTLFVTYLFLHALKHFVHSGVGIRQLFDISLFAGSCGQKTDWGFVYRAAESAGAVGWYAAVLSVLRNEIGLDTVSAGIPSGHIGRTDTAPLVNDIISGAVFGAYDMARHHSGSITLGEVEGGGLLKTLFPPLRVMKKRYPFLEDRPFLLPTAWLRRIAGYRKEAKKTGASLSRSLEIGNGRKKLLKKYGVGKKRRGTPTFSERK